MWVAALLVFALTLGGCALDQSRMGRTGAISTETPLPTVVARTSAPAQTPPPTRAAAPTVMPTPTPGASLPAGTVQEGHFRSVALDSDVHYIVYLPHNYATSGLRYPVIYLLHGKSGRMSDWLHVKSDLDRLIAEGKIPPMIAVLPDAPYSKGASYYVDSAYAGSETVPAGQKVETAFTRDAIAHIDTTYRTIPTREGRAVGGYSMGGWGAMRYALAHPDLYRASIVLSPAVYIPLPPAESGMRALGAFGKGSTLFDDATYQSKRTTLSCCHGSFDPQNCPLRCSSPRATTNIIMSDQKMSNTIWTWSHITSTAAWFAPRTCRPSCASCRAHTAGKSGSRLLSKESSTSPSSSKRPHRKQPNLTGLSKSLF